MQEEWAARGWRITFDKDKLLIARKSAEYELPRSQYESLDIRWHYSGWWISDGQSRLIALKWLGRKRTLKLRELLREYRFTFEVANAVTWQSQVIAFVSERLAIGRWITHDETSGLIESRPNQRLLSRIRRHNSEHFFNTNELAAAAFLDEPLKELLNATNETIMQGELVAQRSFFDTIESSPLTEEQARAVICLDNRVQVHAAAGSGKTSLIVARAAYVVKKQFINPDSILILAFGAKAKDELERRIETRFANAGINSTGLKVSTFHSLGLAILGNFRGNKPRLAPWIDEGRETDKIVSIAKELSHSNPNFYYKWNLYRHLYSDQIDNSGEWEEDGWNRESKVRGFETFSGFIVKSYGEKKIADFLFWHGVQFEYEKRYAQETADEFHSHYRPDFYYPEIGTWHEHWAIDLDGNAPKEFNDYKLAMEWKREIHKENSTDLIETTYGAIVYGEGLHYLRAELEKRGLELKLDTSREPVNQYLTPLEDRELAELVRSFMAHVKSNSLSKDDVEDRLNHSKAGLASPRTRLFLEIFWTIFNAWQSELAAEEFVDFDDMVNEAARALELENSFKTFDLVMVDEFQDTSFARAKLLKGLLKNSDQMLLAVGDDWQSIFRFAGSDISVIQEFKTIFGPGPECQLTTSFRCGQIICDISTSFVTANPSQSRKEVRASEGIKPGSVSIHFDKSDSYAIDEFLQQLSNFRQSSAQIVNSEPYSVKILGRYQFQNELLPVKTYPGLSVTFSTVHQAKGLEADYVLIPGMNSSKHGFPSQVFDDPVLQLVMSADDIFELAEERRLFYVALTRARKGVVLIAPVEKPSAFVLELLNNPLVRVLGTDGKRPRLCPNCRTGLIQPRFGANGDFFGCSNFPKCRFTQNI